MAQQPKQEKSTIDALKDISNLLDKMNKRHECIVEEQEPCNNCGKTLREQMNGCSQITCYRQFFDKEPKQEIESIEDAARNYVSNHEDLEVRRMYGHYYRTFIAGAKSNAAKEYWFSQFKK